MEGEGGGTGAVGVVVKEAGTWGQCAVGVVVKEAGTWGAVCMGVVVLQGGTARIVSNDKHHDTHSY